MPRISKNKKKDKGAESKSIKRKADNTDNENMSNHNHKKVPLTDQELLDASNAKIGGDSDSETTASSTPANSTKLSKYQPHNNSSHHSLSPTKSNSATNTTISTKSSQPKNKSSSSPSEILTPKDSTPKPPLVYSKSNCGPYIVFIEPRSSSSSSPSSLNPTTIGRLLSPSYSPNLISIKSSGKNKITISLKNSASANKLISDNILFQNNLKASIPHHRLFRQGIIRNIPKDLTDNHILNSLDSHILITGARRLKRRSNINPSASELVDTNSILITFDGQTLPTHVKLFSVIHEVELYISPTKMCYACFRYGHLKSLCKGKCLCSHCGHKQHDSSDTTDVCSRHDLPPLCINCMGEHLPTDKSCPEYIFQRKVHHYAAIHNTSIQEALNFLATNDPPTHISRSVQTIKLSTSKNTSSPPTSSPQHFPLLPRHDSNSNPLKSSLPPRNTSNSSNVTHYPSHQPTTSSSQRKTSYAASLNSRLTPLHHTHIPEHQIAPSPSETHPSQPHHHHTSSNIFHSSSSTVPSVNNSSSNFSHLSRSNSPFLQSHFSRCSSQLDSQPDENLSSQSFSNPNSDIAHILTEIFHTILLPLLINSNLSSLLPILTSLLSNYQNNGLHNSA
ncbi:uncharacterized protein LOC111694249 [Trichogramma pretiosum]|uniref:uncharacterized protein LOC111694249 n=1 Tax=Trichogramma pretiosum TaxID=7493 RepID=UPI000C71AC5B|nr:uncharacterized protein LOC111694249 [Trichogramma pretiosum]